MGSCCAQRVHVLSHHVGVRRDLPHMEHGLCRCRWQRQRRHLHREWGGQLHGERRRQQHVGPRDGRRSVDLYLALFRPFQWLRYTGDDHHSDRGGESSNADWSPCHLETSTLPIAHPCRARIAGWLSPALCATQDWFGWDVIAANLLFTAAGVANLGCAVVMSILSGPRVHPDGSVTQLVSDRHLLVGSLALALVGWVVMIPPDGWVGEGGARMSLLQFSIGFTLVTVAHAQAHTCPHTHDHTRARSRPPLPPPHTYHQSHAPDHVLTAHTNTSALMFAIDRSPSHLVVASASQWWARSWAASLRAHGWA